MAAPPTPTVVDLGHEELETILERAARGPLGPEDQQKLKAALETLLWLTEQLEHKRVSIARLKKLLFGASTETAKNLLGVKATAAQPDASAREANRDPQSDAGASAETQKDQEEPRPKGHGRNAAQTYTGAERLYVPHPQLRAGDICPGCRKGRVYAWTPRVLVRVTGQAPLKATRVDLETLRCNLCLEVLVAPAPEGLGEERYDETSAAMIALLRYGSGLPFNRLERLEGSLGIPLPASTQWDIVREAAQRVEPIYAEYVRRSAQGQLLSNDDTKMRILEFMGLRAKDALMAADAETTQEDQERTGIFTTGILSDVGAQRIALFMTGRRHAGENLAAVLAHRGADLEPPIQMCDALSRNVPEDLKTIVSNCLVHGRRQFVDVFDSFPEACRYVIEELGQVFRNEALAREEGLSPNERLIFHRLRSGPIMENLKRWMDAQLKEKIVEPSSALGKAFKYMANHWPELTRFLQVPGAPLDNNAVERALKKAIIHRKNSMFYKTQNGARVGDIYMSLIYTAELAQVSAFDYLVALLRHKDQVQTSPQEWMPWNFKATLAALEDTAAGPL